MTNAQSTMVIASPEVLGGVHLPKTMAQKIADFLREKACYVRGDREFRELRAMIAALSAPAVVVQSQDLRDCYIAAWSKCERDHNPALSREGSIMLGVAAWSKISGEGSV